jgi:amino acid transporter
MTRIVYAMSRDKRVPGWQFLHRINDGLKTPIYATVCVGVLFLILLLVFGRSANALNTIGLTSSVLPPIMYGGPVLIALFRRNRLPKSSAWSLGRWEAPVNIAAAVFILLELFTLRDSSLKQGWIYLGVAIAVGVAYLIVRRITQGPLTAPGATAYSPDDAVAARHSSPSTQEPSFEPWEQE